MKIKKWQEKVDRWILDYGVRYFDVKTNTILLMEEVGEVARLIARTHGEQSFKVPISPEEQHKLLADELGDVFFVLTCIANQTGIDLTEVLNGNLEKKSLRDHHRHQNNPKLKDPLL